MSDMKLKKLVSVGETVQFFIGSQISAIASSIKVYQLQLPLIFLTAMASALLPSK
jgi:hypothetical protein